MKTLLSSLIVVIFSATAFAQGEKESQPKEKDILILEAACGQCMFGMKEQRGCDLAVRMEGKSYFVDGVTKSEIGDAHGEDGMCNVIRKARVSGAVVDGRFKAESFKFLPVSK
jgi:hypothetical protein